MTNPNPGRAKLRRALAAALLTAIGSTAALGQTPSRTALLNQAVRNNWVRFQITAGRVRIAAAQVGNLNTSTGSPGYSERLSILQFDSSGPSFRYELDGSKEKLSLEASGSRFRLTYSGRSEAPSTPVEFRQSAGEPSCLTIGAEGRQQVFRAPSLWHLWILEPEACRQRLAPLLELLAPDWKLEKVAAEVEKQLLRMASGGALLDRARWAALVEQLGDQQFARREAADRQLRAASPAVVGYLEQLDFGRLDAEQQFRVRRIIGGVSRGLTGEMADQIAAWLSGDAGVWLSLLSRPDAATRQLAARQLAAMLGEPIGFDPEADEAVRTDQIEKLRARVESSKSLGTR